MGILTAGRHIGFIEKLLPELVKPSIKRSVKSYRLVTANLRLHPDFIIIGARKCGTTSLYCYLVNHPMVLPALKKEIFYFTHYQGKGKDWYRSHFPTTIERWFTEKIHRHKVITGEATSSYIFNPEVPQLVYEMNPMVKIIAVLRNPIDALYSAYQFGIKMNTYTREEVVFDNIIESEIQALKDKPSNYLADNYATIANKFLLSRGLYLNMLEFWYEMFPPSSLHIIISESLFNNPQATMERLFKFLDLPSHSMKNYEKCNVNSYSEMSPRIREMLANFFAPHNQKLQDRLGIETGWEV